MGTASESRTALATRTTVVSAPKQNVRKPLQLHDVLHFNDLLFIHLGKRQQPPQFQNFMTSQKVTLLALIPMVL